MSKRDPIRESAQDLDMTAPSDPVSGAAAIAVIAVRGGGPWAAQ